MRYVVLLLLLVGFRCYFAYSEEHRLYISPVSVTLYGIVSGIAILSVSYPYFYKKRKNDSRR